VTAEKKNHRKKYKCSNAPSKLTAFRKESSEANLHKFRGETIGEFLWGM